MDSGGSRNGHTLPLGGLLLSIMSFSEFLRFYGVANLVIRMVNLKVWFAQKSITGEAHKISLR